MCHHAKSKYICCPSLLNSTISRPLVMISLSVMLNLKICAEKLKQYSHLILNLNIWRWSLLKVLQCKKNSRFLPLEIENEWYNWDSRPAPASGILKKGSDDVWWYRLDGWRWTHEVRVGRQNGARCQPLLSKNSSTRSSERVRINLHDEDFGEAQTGIAKMGSVFYAQIMAQLALLVQWGQHILSGWVRCILSQFLGPKFIQRRINLFSH